MCPTPEARERQRKAAHKAWETIRRKRGEVINAKSPSPQVRPIKKWDLRQYPTNWREIGAGIRERSKNVEREEQCECRGECLKHPGRCKEINGTWAKHRRRRGKVKVRFTIAHLCHTPSCDDKSHLKAMCEPCHLIYDLRCRQRRLSGEDAVRWALDQGLLAASPSVL